ncbi:histidine phosphatase family protein [Thiospirochaeta perfilievii]|uniref:histidine phosphatase family protein n=1 Tax=Thiospirochaeta perfilievii TaxID=252967 RepID=UPI0016592534|nr:histidine phosphatase family protein [Thiospirochaeta perfilievii]
MVELVFIRHGQTNWNLEGKLQGIIDIPLNDRGVEEAILLSSKIDKEFKKIISSPLDRALKTAQIVNNNLNIPIELEERIMERNFGELAGQEASFVKTMRESTKDYGVETIKDFTNKLLDFLGDCSKLESGRYLVFTHGGVIISLLSHLSSNKINWENTPIKNCSLTGLKYSQNWEIDFINSHALDINKISC